VPTGNFVLQCSTSRNNDRGFNCETETINRIKHGYPYRCWRGNYLEDSEFFLNSQNNSYLICEVRNRLSAHLICLLN
jgi:hypothetical protein